MKIQSYAIVQRKVKGIDMARDKAPEKTDMTRVRDAATEALAALDALDEIVEGYLKASKQRRDHFGVMAVNQADFIYNMRKGRDFRRSTMRRVFAYIQAA